MRQIQSKQKGGAAIAVLFCMGVLLFAVASAGANSLKGTGRLAMVQGSVAVQNPKGLWQPAGQGWILLPGRWLKTGPDSRCELILGQGTVVRLDKGAMLRIDKPRRASGQKKADWQLRLEDGAYWINACGAQPGSSATVRVIAAKGQFTAEKTLAGVNVVAGVPRFHVYAKDSGDHSRTQASANLKQPHVVTMEEWVEIVRSFRRYTGGTAGSTGLSEADREYLRNDPWFRWNLNRDRTLGLGCP